MPVSRRTFLSGASAGGALLVASGRGALASPLGGRTGIDEQTMRASRLFPATRVAHADWHNHSLISDGDGDAALAFASMRDAGLDIAALTDHSTVSKFLPEVSRELTCAPVGCGLAGLDEAGWDNTAGFADSANNDGSFTAIRGFEWSSPTLGHVNVWFSQDWIDPLSTNGNTTGSGIGQFSHQVPGIGPVVSGPLDDAVRALPTTGLGMRGFYDWLSRDPATPVMAGGLDAIAGFNHPGREPGRFGAFTFDQRLVERIVSIEVFNRGEDYLFEGLEDDVDSPIVECLDASWRVGLLGVSDEHGTDWGYPDGKGRTGVWVSELSRGGVREAMEARRFFSTRLRGLRLDAAMNGVRMGQVVGHRNGEVQVELDLDRGTGWAGRPLVAQLLQTGRPLPTIVHEQAFVVPREDQPVVSFRAPIDVEDGRWVMLRIVDAEQEIDERGPAEFNASGGAIAYAAPFFLDPDRAPAAMPEADGSQPGGSQPGSPPAGSPAPQGTPPGSAAPAGAGGTGSSGTGSTSVSNRTLPTTGAGTTTAVVGAAALAAAAAHRRLGTSDDA